MFYRSLLAVAPAVLLACPLAAEAQFGRQQLGLLRQNTSGAQFSSSFFVNQAKTQGVGVFSGQDVPLVTPPPRTNPLGNRRSLGAANTRTRAPQRPFSNIQRRPSVSPYLGLFNASFDGEADALNYQTIVRPQLRQQQFNQQVSRQAAQINARLQSIQAQSGFNPQGNPNFAPTGTGGGVYRNYLQYYSFPQR